MFLSFTRSKKLGSFRVISFTIIFSFLTTTLIPVPLVRAQGVSFLNLPVPGIMVHLSEPFVPVLLKGLTIDPKDPFRFDFIVDSGNESPPSRSLPTGGGGQGGGENIQQESEKLTKYFLAALTIPKDDLWVNLSPNEPERIIPDELAKTELGRDMLAQDYLLKQLTASLMYPEEELGKKFWQRIKEKTAGKFDGSEIPLETLNKVWILPEKAVVYEHGNTVYVVEARLKVMMDEEYEAMGNATPTHPSPMNGEGKGGVSELQSQIIRETILPEIEKEVNEGKNFACLRQMYYSLILAKWYKETLEESLLSSIYLDQKKTAGIELEDPTIKDQIYQQYMEAYKKGVYNYIKEDYDALAQEVIPRKYFSGGIDKLMNVDMAQLAATPVNATTNAAMVQDSIVGKSYRLALEMTPLQNGSDRASLLPKGEASSRGDRAMVARKAPSADIIKEFEGYDQRIKDILMSHRARIRSLINRRNLDKISKAEFEERLQSEPFYQEIISIYGHAQEHLLKLVLRGTAGLEDAMRMRIGQLLRLSEFIQKEVGISGPDFVPYQYTLQSTEDALAQKDPWVQETQGFIKRRIVQRDSRPGVAGAKIPKLYINQPYIPQKDLQRDSKSRQPEKVLLTYEMENMFGDPQMKRGVWVTTNPFAFGGTHFQIIDSVNIRQHLTLPFLRVSLDLLTRMPGLTGIFNSEGANASQPHPHIQVWQKGRTAIDELRVRKKGGRGVQFLGRLGKVKIGKFIGNQKYKAKAFVFEVPDNKNETLNSLSFVVQAFVNDLKMRDIPHNLVFKGKRVFVFPRRSIVPDKFGQTFAGAELAGEIFISSGELVHTNHGIEGMTKEKYTRLLQIVNNPKEGKEKKKAVLEEINGFIKTAFDRLGAEEINKAYEQRINVDTTVYEELEQDLLAVVQFANEFTVEDDLKSLQRKIHEAITTMTHERVRGKNRIFYLVLANMAFNFSPALRERLNLREAIAFILERLQVGRALEESLTLNFARFQLEEKMEVLEREWQRLKKLDLGEDISESLEKLELTPEEREFLEWYTAIVEVEDKKHIESLRRTKKLIGNLLRLRHNIGFTGLGFDIEREYLPAVSLANHDLRVGELAYRAALRYPDIDAQEAEFIGLVHDYAAIPFRFYARAGKLGEELKKVGYISGREQGIVYREKQDNIRRLKEDGFRLSHQLEHDLGYFDIYNERAVFQMSKEAKIAIASESVEGVVEDILSGLKFGLITVNDLLGRDLPKPIEEIAVMDPNVLKQRLEADFDNLILEISEALIKKEWTTDEFVEHAREIKTQSRKNLIYDKVFDSGNVLQLDRQKRKVTEIMTVVFERYRKAYVDSQEARGFIPETNADVYYAVDQLSRMSEEGVLKEYEAIIGQATQADRAMVAKASAVSRELDKELRNILDRTDINFAREDDPDKLREKEKIFDDLKEAGFVPPEAMGTFQTILKRSTQFTVHQYGWARSTLEILFFYDQAYGWLPKISSSEFAKMLKILQQFVNPEEAYAPQFYTLGFKKWVKLADVIWNFFQAAGLYQRLQRKEYLVRQILARPTFINPSEGPWDHLTIELINAFGFRYADPQKAKQVEEIIEKKSKGFSSGKPARKDRAMVAEAQPEHIAKAENLLRTLDIGPGSRVFSIGPGYPLTSRAEREVFLKIAPEDYLRHLVDEDSFDQYWVSWEKLSLSLGADVSIFEPNQEANTAWQEKRNAWPQLSQRLHIVDSSLARFETAEFEPHSADAVVIMSIFSDPNIPEDVKRQIALKAFLALRPGGHIIVGNFNKAGAFISNAAERRSIESLTKTLEEDGHTLSVVENGEGVEPWNPFSDYRRHEWLTLKVESPNRARLSPKGEASLRGDRAMVAERIPIALGAGMEEYADPSFIDQVKALVTAHPGITVLAASAAIASATIWWSQNTVEGIAFQLKYGFLNLEGRSKALKILGKSRRKKAIHYLIKELWAPEAPEISEALIKIGIPVVMPLIEEFKKGFPAEAAFNILARIGDKRAFEPISGFLHHRSAWYQQWAATALGVLGDNRAIGPLKELLLEEEQDFTVHVAAAEALHKLDHTFPEPSSRDQQLKDLLNQVYRAKTTEESVSIIRKIGQLGDERVLSSLMRMIDLSSSPLPSFSSPDKKIAVVQALGQMRGPKSFEALLKLLEAPRPHVQKQAILALGERADMRAIDPLLNMEINNINISALSHAVEVLKKIGASEEQIIFFSQRLIRVLVQTSRGPSPSNLVALKRESMSLQEVISDLIEVFSEETQEPGIVQKKSIAARILGSLGDRTVVPTFIAQLPVWESWRDDTLVEALGKLGDPRALDPLMGQLRARGSGIVQSAMESIRKLNPNQSFLIEAFWETLLFHTNPDREENEDQTWGSSVTMSIPYDYLKSAVYLTKELIGLGDNRGIQRLKETLTGHVAKTYSRHEGSWDYMELVVEANPSYTFLEQQIIEIERQQSIENIDRAMVGVQGLLFKPELDFLQDQPLTSEEIRMIRSRRRNDDSAVKEILGRARTSGVELSITGHLRGADIAGSSLDIPEFQRTLTPLHPQGFDQLPSTLAIASKFTTKVTFQLSEEHPDDIVYVAPDYGITQGNPLIYSGDIQLDRDGKLPRGQLDAPGYIARNVFGLKGIQITLEAISPMALAGGMESSSVFNTALVAAASILSGADLSPAEIFSLTVKLENNEFGNLTGGQGHLATFTGGAYQQIWTSGIKDSQGKFSNPYSAVLVPLLSENQLRFVEQHIMLVQAGKEYVNGRPVIRRTADLTNNMWTDLLRDRDSVGLPLHREKVALTIHSKKALQKGDFEMVSRVAMRYVEIRDQLVKRWLGLLLDARAGKDVPVYAKEYARKVFDSSHPEYKNYQVIRDLLQEKGEEGLRETRLYTLDPIAGLVEAGSKQGIALMPLGAGGPGSNLIAIDPQGVSHLRGFLELQGLSEIEEEKAREIIRGTGILRGFTPFKVGREPMTFEGFGEAGLAIPKLPVSKEVTGQEIGISDRAMTAQDVGGIDMNTIEMNRQGEGVKVQFDPAMSAPLFENIQIDGFKPVTINFEFLPSILPLLGLEPTGRKEEIGLSILN